MPQHPFARPKGRMVEFSLASPRLARNLLGDPDHRTISVYLPEGYDESTDDYPLFVDMVGFTGSGFSHIGWKAYEENVPQRIDRLIAEGKMGPVICVFPDAFTSLGGNQYINSAAMGEWADYLLLDMIPELEKRFRVRAGAQHRACFGKSSGGYGAIIHGMRYADHWGAIACHSGDMGFELVYGRDMAPACDALGKHGSIEAFLSHLRTCTKLGGADFHVLMTLAMAATYDPDPSELFGIQLPVDIETCELIDERWQQWLRHDPVQCIEEDAVQQNLRSLRGVYIDCGSKDQYYLHYGARRLVRRLKALDIAHTYEEFPDTHSGINYRMDVSLPFLYDALTSG